MGKVVHIIDDEAMVRDSLELLLRLHGYKSRSYASGDEFLATFDEKDVGCILLDLRLPGASGLEVIEKLGPCRSQVILLSGQMDAALGARAILAGASEVIEKPYEPEDLIRAIEAAFASMPAS